MLPPDLARLEDTYDLQSELRRTARSVIWLARHRVMGRDVTVTVIDAGTPPEQETLARIAADTRLLAGLRHPNVVPVIESRWLSPSRLAVARARVRGTTVAQVLASVGPMPEPRAIDFLRELGSVLDWAESGGIAHRYVTTDHLCFQQGSGRLLATFGLPLALEGEAPAPADELRTGADDPCTDTVMLARIGHELLTARRYRPGDEARIARTGVSDRVAYAIEQGLRCDPRAPLDTRRFLGMLGEDQSHTGLAAIATAASAPVVPRGAMRPVPEPALPLIEPAASATSAAIAAERTESGAGAPPAAPPSPPHPAGGRRRGRAALVLSMLALAAVIGTTFALIHRERTERAARADAREPQRADAGDVDVTEPIAPTEGIVRRGAGGEARDACESPASADQRACLMERVEANDRDLNSVYQSVLRELGTRGAAAAESLRAGQREWLARRDRECAERIGTDGLWAVKRAECFAEFTRDRLGELRARQ